VSGMRKSACSKRCRANIPGCFTTRFTTFCVKARMAARQRCRARSRSNPVPSLGHGERPRHFGLFTPARQPAQHGRNRRNRTSSNPERSASRPVTGRSGGMLPSAGGLVPRIQPRLGDPPGTRTRGARATSPRALNPRSGLRAGLYGPQSRNIESRRKFASPLQDNGPTR